MNGGGGKVLERRACWLMCGGMEEWRSDGENGTWLFPPLKRLRRVDIA